MLVNKFCALASLVIAVCYVSTAAASIQTATITSTGDTATLATYEEGQGTLAANLPVNVIEPAFTGAGVIPSGRYVASHLIEVAHPPSGAVDYVLNVTFDLEIIGVAYKNTELNSSKAALDASSGFSAVADGGQLNNGDIVTFSGNQLSLTVDGAVGSGVDSLRVITRAIPEATSLLCWCGLVGIVAGARKRRMTFA